MRLPFGRIRYSRGWAQAQHPWMPASASMPSGRYRETPSNKPMPNKHNSNQNSLVQKLGQNCLPRLGQTNGGPQTAKATKLESMTVQSFECCVLCMGIQTAEPCGKSIVTKSSSTWVSSQFHSGRRAIITKNLA